MSNEAVEYVRGIPVVKTFGQSVFSFKKFKATIDEYEKWVVAYTKDMRMPMMLYTAAINGVFAFLIAGGLLFTKSGVTPEFLLNLLFYIIIAHRMRTVAGADKIVVLSDGVVAEQGAPDALYAQNRIYTHMVQLQTVSQNWTI